MRNIQKTKIKSLLIFVLMGIFCLECAEQERKVSFKSEEEFFNNQKFTVIPVFYNMKDLVNEGRKAPEKINQLYKERIYNPMYDQFIGDCEFSEIMNTIENFSSDYYALEKEISLLENSNITQNVLMQLKYISSELEGPNTTIILLPMNPDLKITFKKYNLGNYYTGVSAIAPCSGKIIISIDPREKDWSLILNYIIAHEYHHSVWTFRNFKRKDLSVLEYLIFEGRADYFASALYPNLNVPWINNLSQDKEREVLEHIKNNLESRDEEYIKDLEVGNEIIPYGIFYSIGYSIVSNYMKNHPQTNLTQFTDLSPKEILAGSDYQSYVKSMN